MVNHALLFLLGPYILLSLVSGAFLYLGCGKFVKIREKAWGKLLLLVTFTLASSLVVWIGDNNFALMLPFYLAAFYLSTEGDWLGRLTVGGIFFCLTMAVCAITDSYQIPLGGYTVSRIIRPLFFGLLYLLLTRASHKQVQLPHRLWNLCAGLTLLPFVTLAVLILPTYWMEDFNHLTLFQGVFLLPLTILVSVMILLSILVLDDYEEKAQAVALSQMREVYYENLQREQRQIRTMRHDLRNHLNTIQGLLDQGQESRAREYLNQLTESPALQRTRRLCDNELVNVVLASKCQEMEEKEIRADLKIHLPVRLPLQDTDLCALLGNALDNALEAAAKSRDKKIFLRCRAEQGMFMLLLQNSLAGNERPDLSTTKKDKKHHGFGLAGMEEIARRYGGVLEAGPKEGLFELVVNIPLKDAGEKPAEKN